MKNTRIIPIDLGPRSYDIYVGAGLCLRMGDLLPFDIKGKKFFIVADEHVVSVVSHIETALKNAEAGVVQIKTLAAGEGTKSFAHVEEVTSWMLAHGITRDSCVMAVGGGVIGDLVGFCASIVLRGVSYVQVPTTLLSQVDSAVGGKTGINTQHGKNLVGSFYQPKAVIIDLETLKTLPRRQILAGYAEIAKYGLINDLPFFTWLKENGAAVCNLQQAELIHAIETSCKAKAAIVEADEREGGQRALLNLGHTFAHALEIAAGYDGRLLHGEAVAIGMVMAFDLSVRMGICKPEDLERVEGHLITLGLPTRASFITPPLDTSVDALYSAMQRDKKVKANTLNMILVRGIGEAYITSDVSEDLIRDVLHDSLGGETSGDSNAAYAQWIKDQWTSAFSSR